MKKNFLIAFFLLFVISCNGGGGGGGNSGNSGNGGDSSGGGNVTPPASKYTIKGIVGVPDNAFVDYDPALSSGNANNSSSNVQFIKPTSTTGGYVNSQTDSSDWYLFNSTGNETISFQADPGVIAKTGKNPDSLTEIFGTYNTSVSGNYYIHVSVLNGKGNYRIDIKPKSGSLPSNFSKKSNFVPGEVIVKFKDGARSLSSDSGDFQDLEIKKEYEDFTVFKITKRSLKSLNSDSESLKEETLELIEKLNNNPNVEHAEPNFIRKVFETPNDAYYQNGDQWGIDLINLRSAWEKSKGSDVIVAVLDSGITNHEDLPLSRVLPGYDFADKDNDPTDPGVSNNGSTYHGPHVTGIIAAEMNNNKGIAGAAPQCKIMPLRIVSYEIKTTDIIDSIKYAAGIANSSGKLPAKRADIINMSFGGPSFSYFEKNAVNTAAAKGVILVAATGNDGFEITNYPAGYENVIGVGAVDSNGTRASYSNYGSHVSLAGPGGGGFGGNSGVISFGGPGSSEYRFASGTSMATPYVAGVLALMKSLNQDLDNSIIMNFIRSGKITNDKGYPGYDIEYGYGLIDALKAVNSSVIAAPDLNIYAAVKKADGTELKKVKASKSGSDYSFEITEIPVGSYSVISGIDLNGDGDFDDLGELKVSSSINVEKSDLNTGRLVLNS